MEGGGFYINLTCGSVIGRHIETSFARKMIARVHAAWWV